MPAHLLRGDLDEAIALPLPAHRKSQHTDGAPQLRGVQVVASPTPDGPDHIPCCFTHGQAGRPNVYADLAAQWVCPFCVALEGYTESRRRFVSAVIGRGIDG